MIPPDLVQAAADAKCLIYPDDYKCGDNGNLAGRDRRQHPECVIAAAFAALPAYLEKNPPEPIVVGRHPQWFRGFDDCLAYLAREFGEPTCPPHDFDLLRQCRKCGLGAVAESSETRND